jgi:tetratricopeptide (TPR) repeat protein
MTIERAVEAARAAMLEDDFDAAWTLLRPHRGSLRHSAPLALRWAALAESTDRGAAMREDLEEILAAWPEDPAIVDAAANALLGPVDGRPADDAIPDDDPTHRVIPALRRCLGSLDDRHAADPEVAGYLFNTLGNAYRLGGVRYDAAAEAAYESALATDPSRSWWRFNLGLLYKNRARFREGLEVYRRVHAEVGDEQAVLWNLAICATCEGEGEAARSAWARLGLQTELGDDGLPRMAAGPAKVRLSTAKIGSTHPSDDLPIYEHVWVSRRSPCHGVVGNPTLHDVGGDIGDVVVWDGQPIGYFQDGDERRPRFAALAWRGSTGTRTFRFAASFPDRAALESVRATIGDRFRLYVFQDEIEYLCAECIRTGGPHDATHAARPTLPLDSGVAHGKIVVEPGCELTEAWHVLDAATHAASVRLATPQLLAAVGDDVGRRRHEALWSELDTT